MRIDEVDEVVGDAVGGQAAGGVVPRRDAVDGAEDGARGDRWVGDREDADGDPRADPSTEALLVGIAALEDRGAALRPQGPPLVDEDTRLVDVGGEDLDVRPNEGGDRFRRVTGSMGRRRERGPICGRLEPAGRPDRRSPRARPPSR